MVLGSVTQMILLAGYHTTLYNPGPKSTQGLHKSRLLYRAYVLDQDLSLRLGKPALLNESLISRTPNEYPEDSQDIKREGTTINCLREQVFLARIQNKAWEALRSQSPSTKLSKEFLDSASQLLEQLQQWKQRLATSTRRPETLAEFDGLQQMQLTELHLNYYQTVIAVHSAIFSHPSLFSDPAVRDQAAVAVGQCADAVREMLDLAKRIDQNHPMSP